MPTGRPGEAKAVPAPVSVSQYREPGIVISPDTCSLARINKLHICAMVNGKRLFKCLREMAFLQDTARAPDSYDAGVSLKKETSMSSTVFPRQSLKTRITLITLAVFVLGLWSLAFYASQMLRKDMALRLGEQQFSTVSMVAAELERTLETRFKALEVVASSSVLSLDDPATMQAMIEQRPVLQVLFNGGIVAYDVDGSEIADFSLAPGWRSDKKMDGDLVAAVLRNGQRRIGQPIVGKPLDMPMLALAVPIRDMRDGVIGVLLGVINLETPNFLDGITESRYGKTGGYLLIAPQRRLVIAATDKGRVMDVLPAPGSNPLIDRFIDDAEGSVVMVNPLGTEMLASDKKIPVAGWIIAAVLPTEEAFAPIRTMQQRMLSATIILTLLVGGLVWWMLHRQFSPLRLAVRRLTVMSDTRRPLPITRPDEIGQLIGSFNGLLASLSQREMELQSSEMRFRNLLQTIPSVAIQSYGADGITRYWNAASEQLYGYTEAEAIGRSLLDLIIPPEMHDEVRGVMQKIFENRETSTIEERSLVRKDGSKVDIISSHAYVHVPGLPPEMFCVHVDLTERKRMEAALRQREEYLRALLDNFPFMVWLKDSESRFLAVNQPFASAFGWPSAQSLIGRNDLDITRPDLAEAYRADDRAVLASGASKQVEELLEVSGQRRWFEIFKSPVTVDGCVIGTVGFARDISKRKRNEAALLAATAEAERANNAKSRFLAAASHDLRQPLAALSLYIGVLRSKIPPESLELLEHIQDCVDSLSELLTDLLDMSKLDAGVVTPSFSDFAIDELLVPLLSVHEAEAGLKSLRLRLRHSSAIVHSDQVLLRRILGNFLSNAIRYTESGGVLVACRRHQGKLWAEVWDTGVGIAEENVEIIFEEFRQLDDSARNRGSGLGLAIAAKAARLLGLEIRLHSRPGRGSMFAIELPQGCSTEPESIQPDNSLPSALRIGLVEDNPSVLRALVLALESTGNVVLAATSARELFRRLDGVRPDIVISDYRLNGTETGFDVIKEARMLFGQDLPAVLITGDTDPALIRSMVNRGIAVHYKPVKIEVLRAFIRQASERRSS